MLMVSSPNANPDNAIKKKGHWEIGGGDRLGWVKERNKELAWN